MPQCSGSRAASRCSRSRSIFLWFGIEFTRFAWNRISELAELPLWLIHIAWPLTGATWLVFQGERMADDFGVLAAGRPA